MIILPPLDFENGYNPPSALIPPIVDVIEPEERAKPTLVDHLGRPLQYERQKIGFALPKRPTPAAGDAP